MFDILRKKFNNWFGLKEKAEEKRHEEKTKKKKVEKEKIKKVPTEEKLKKRADKVKEETPLEFNVIKQKYEPDVLVIQELEKEKREEIKKEFEKEGFFTRLKNKLTSSELKEEDFNEFFSEFEITLLENNVALEVVDKIRESLSKELIGKNFKKTEAEKKILEALKNSIEKILIEDVDLIKKIKESEKPFVILFFGINGSGKTTSVAKLAFKLKKERISCVLGAADTFRAASIEQLEEHAEKVGVQIIKRNYGADPAAVAYDAIQFAKKEKISVVLIDTAGRMYTKINLIREMEKVVRVAKPNLKIFVGESITGNDATEQAKTFNEAIGIDGIILTKADVDEKAGTILSVSYVTGKPIYFLGVGQEYGDLKEFSKRDIFKNLGLE